VDLEAVLLLEYLHQLSSGQIMILVSAFI
jgi:hypothetical protein